MGDGYSKAVRMGSWMPCDLEEASSAGAVFSTASSFPSQQSSMSFLRDVVSIVASESRFLGDEQC